MQNNLNTLAEILKNAVLAELTAQENGTSSNILLDKTAKGSIACDDKKRGKNDNKTA